MDHIANHVWADVARGVLGSPAAQQAETHLASGCGACRHEFELWRSLANLAANERHYTPPDDIVRLAKLSICAQALPVAESETFAQLMFDSFSNPLPVGIRGAATGMRQVVYESEGLTVDIRFEPRPQTGTYLTSGQVLDALAPNASMPKAMIFLWTGRGQLIATTEANDFGEFQLEFEPQDQMRISIAMVGRRTLRIPLGDLN